MNHHLYVAFKVMHLLGVVLLIGNVTVSAIWKVFADRTGQPALMHFAHRLVVYTDWSLTLSGALLIMVGGYGMVYLAGWNPWAAWLLWAQVLFYASGLIWVLRLVPLQVQQSRSLRRSGPGAVDDPVYRRLCRHWIAWGVIATVPLVVTTWLMVAKG